MRTIKALFTGLLAAAAMAASLATAGTVTYYHNDLTGSPVVATNAAGQVIWRESYRPYGERTVNSAQATDNKVWFTSRRQDPDTGLVYMGARYYDPVVGRFVSTDPVGFDEKNLHSFNRYAYANNNPYRYHDPDGKTSAALALGAAAGVVIGGGFALLPPEGKRALMQGIGLLGQHTVYGHAALVLNGILHNESSSEGGGKSGEKPSIVSPEAAEHILAGDKDGKGGGHRHGAGRGKSEFPKGWSDEKILGEISDVATDPGSTRRPGRFGREVAEGRRDGVDIRVITDPKTGIVTGFPIN